MLNTLHTDARLGGKGEPSSSLMKTTFVKSLLRSLRPLVTLLTLTATLTLAPPALAQTTEGCYPLQQSQSGNMSVTLWCAIYNDTSASPLSTTWDTGVVPIQRAFTANWMHVQYDNWYAPMDSNFSVEIGTFTQAVVLPPISIGENSGYTQDIWLGGISATTSNTIRITESSWIPHTCNAVDNCGLHMTITFQ